MPLSSLRVQRRAARLRVPFGVLLAVALAVARCTEPPEAGEDVSATPEVVDALAADIQVAPDVPEVPDPGPQVDVVPQEVAQGLPCKGNADCPASDAPCTESRCQPSGFCAVVLALDGTPCEDGDPCTSKDTCTGGACLPGPKTCGCVDDSECAFLDDANLCNGKWTCDTTVQPTVCTLEASSVVKCAPGWDTPCQAEACNPATGKCEVQASGDGEACDDGDPCTDKDNCQAGQCVSGKDTCACHQNADCQDDGDLCNGTPYCDKSSAPYGCKTNPGSVVTCSPAGDTACKKNTCDPKTGGCSLQAGPDGAACDDGDPCTGGDSCKGGVCQAGANLCGCQSDGDCAKFDDGNPCNGTLFCNKTVGPHVCQVNPATLVVCPSVQDSDCSKNVCNPSSGKCEMTAQPDGGACSDDNPCTTDDACAGGKCSAKTNTCPCTSNSNCVDKDDGNLCNGLLFCDKAQLPYVCKVNPATIVTCPTVGDTDCTQAQCAPTTGQCGQVPRPDNTACNADNNACTLGDVCKDGGCVPGPSVCPCQKDSDCAGFEDGNVCNGTLFCDKTKFQCAVNPNTVVTCPIGNDSACLHNVCVPLTGKCAMSPRNQGLPCNADNNPCTQGDVCDTGKCVAGTNTCACKKDGDCAAFEDGNLCNGKLFCNTSKAPFACEVNPATVVTCGSGNPPMCYGYGCDAKTGKCVNQVLPDESPCSDGKACTAGDVCQTGKCVPGTNICACQADADCGAKEDGNLCNGTLYCDKTAVPFQCKINPATVIVCDPSGDTGCLKAACQKATGTCLPQAVTDTASCDDGNQCTVQDHCLGGLCGGLAANCSDGDACTWDVCDPIEGCVHLPSGPQACNDDDACTQDACDPKSGCGHVALTGTLCDDGQACTGPDTCAKGTCQGKAGGGCDDSNVCTDDSCAGDGTGCVHAPNSQPCPFGRKCLNGTCGGCEAFRRTQRTGCDYTHHWPYPDQLPKHCQMVDGNLAREEFADAVVLADGRLGVVGAATDLQTAVTGGWVALYDATGALAVEKRLTTVPAGRWNGAAPLPDGGLWAVGSGKDASETLRPWLARLDKTGGLVASVLLPQASTIVQDAGQFDAVVTLPDGGALAMGASTISGSASSNALAARFDASGKLLWQKQYGQQLKAQVPQNEALHDAVLAPDGTGVVAVGERTLAQQPGVGLQGWVVRLDLDGHLVAESTHGGVDQDAFYGLSRRLNGGWLAAGTFGRKTSVLPGDAWIVALDAAGKPVAQHIEPGPRHEELRVVAERPDGKIAAGGLVHVDAGKVAGTGNQFDVGNGLALLLSADLKVVWNRQVDDLGREVFRGGTVLPNGDLVLVGSTVDPNKPDKHDGLMARVGADGNDYCPCQFFAKRQDVLGQWNEVVPLPDDSVITVGWQQVAGNFPDALLSRVKGKGGEVLWQKSYGQTGTDRLQGLARQADGTLLAVGDTDSTPVGKRNGWVLRLDDTGKVLTDMTYGGQDDDQLQHVLALPDGTWIATGWTMSGSKGKADAWILRLDAKGQKLWEKTWGTTEEDQFAAATLMGSGSDLRIAAVGWRDRPSPPYPDGLIVMYDLDGKEVLGSDGKPIVTFVNTANEPQNPQDWFRDVTTLADGTAVAVGQTCAILYCGGWAVRFDKTGKVLGNKPIAGYYTSWFNAVQAEAGGTFVTVGSQNNANGWNMRMQPAFEAEINAVYFWVAKEQRLDAITDVALLANGNYLEVGYNYQLDAKQNPEVRPTIALRDRAKGHYLGYWGDSEGNDPPCREAGCDLWRGGQAYHRAVACDDDNECTTIDTCTGGKCVEYVANACNDGNPCTADACHPSSGCNFAPTGDGTACGPGKACGGGSCGTCPLTSTITGGPASEEPLVSLPLQDGGSLVVGYQAPSTDANAKSDGLITRLDASGKQVWAATASEGTGSEVLTGVIPSGSGWLAVGWAEDTASKNERDVYLVEVAGDGKVLSKTRQAVAGHQMVRGIRSLGSGAWLGLGDDGMSGWAFQRDATGKVAWEVKLLRGGKGGAIFFDGAPLPGGGHVLVGALKNDLLNDPQALWIVGLDANHAVAWEWFEDRPGYNAFRKVAVGSDGTITAMGVHWNQVGFNLDSRVVRLTSAGKEVWSWATGLADYQNALDGMVLPDGGVLLVGEAHTSYFANGGLIQRISNQGQSLWDVTVVQDHGGSLRTVRLDPDGLVTAIGRSQTGLNKPYDVWTRRFEVGGKIFCGQ